MRTWLPQAAEAADPPASPTPEQMLAVAQGQLVGTPLGTLAQDLGKSQGWVEQVLGLAEVQQHITRIERGVADRMSRGAYGVGALAKSAAQGAMKRVIQLSRQAEDERVLLAANKDVLGYAGVIIEKRVAAVTPDKLLDKLTPDELADFARYGTWPERFRQELAPWLRAVPELPSPQDVEGELLAAEDEDIAEADGTDGD